MIRRFLAWLGRPSAQERLLAALDQQEWKSGTELTATAKIWTGKLYPLLLDFERHGIVESRWAVEPKPRRRLYRLAEKDRAES